MLKNTYFLFCNQNRKYVIFSQKQEIFIFPKMALFHINCYFIGKVSPMYGFLAGFSSPESIFALKNTYFLFCYFIGKVSPMYSFLAGFSSPESIFAEKYLFPVL